ncbi:hypothetical protein H2200_003414 [Cladophialophora chaetospira]|uniref:DNA-directed RNA polymerase III RPC4 n=1 Tax=Cladophialophora chaetospira TaxID=386627 RepID=A0AA38XHE2_9EURO|nr:hypothetical protein H2200_003414 [Cladophialophora chaetospira]
MPESAPSTPKPSTRARGTRPRGGIQRKSKAEREQFEREEAERNKARSAEQQAATRGASGGGRVVNRGRGHAVSGPRQTPVGSRGVFGGGGGAGVTTGTVKPKYEGFAELLEGGASSAPAEDPAQGEVEGGGATGSKEGTTTTGKKSSGRGGASKASTAGAASAPKAAEPLETTTDDEPDDAPKRDIERIQLSSDEEDDVATSTWRKGKQKAANTAPRPSRSGLGLRPVRAPRTSREAEEQAGQDAKSRKKHTGSAKRPDIEPQEVSSDERDGDAMDVAREDSVQVLKERPSSPELRKRAGKKGTAAASRHGPLKALANETIEDRAERLRVQDDVEKLRSIFVSKPSTQDALNDDEEDELDQGEDGTLLLFQLPPLTPFLTDPSALSPEVKAEPSSTTGNATIDLDTIPDAPPPQAPTDGPSLVKPDPETDTPSTKRTLQLDGLLTASEPMRLPAGIVGNLKVHKSGKVTLDWGGTDMEVRLGSEVDFLQDVVLVKPASRDAPDEMDVDGEKGEKKGRAFALGHVRQKMVVIPDWAKLYD